MVNSAFTAVVDVASQRCMTRCTVCIASTSSHLGVGGGALGASFVGDGLLCCSLLVRRDISDGLLSGCFSRRSFLGGCFSGGGFSLGGTLQGLRLGSGLCGRRTGNSLFLSRSLLGRRTGGCLLLRGYFLDVGSRRLHKWKSGLRFDLLACCWAGRIRG